MKKRLTRRDFLRNAALAAAGLALGGCTTGNQEPKQISSPTQETNVDAKTPIKEVLETSPVAKPTVKIPPTPLQDSESQSYSLSFDLDRIEPVNRPIPEDVRKRLLGSIIQYGPIPHAWCSGVHIGEKRFLTARHCFDESMDPNKGRDFFEFYPAKHQDITLMVYKEEFTGNLANLNYVEIGDPKKLNQYDPVIVCNYQETQECSGENQKPSIYRARFLGCEGGLVFLFEDTDADESVIDISNGGGSGGGIFNYQGELMGITSTKVMFEYSVDEPIIIQVGIDVSPYGY